jgi:hypothetical protein
MAANSSLSIRGLIQARRPLMRPPGDLTKSNRVIDTTATMSHFAQISAVGLAGRMLGASLQ